MDSPSTPGAPLFALTFSHASQTARFEISNGLPGDFSASTRLLPENFWLIERTRPRTTRPLCSGPHYRGLSATTSRSASASRDSTQPLTASAPLGALPLARPHQQARQYRDTPSPVPHGSRRPGSRRLHAGHRLASKRTPARLIPR